MATNNTHIHTYERSISNKSVYRCIDPDCMHYHTAEFLIGKKSICNKCKRPFLLERWMLIGKMAVRSPMCLDCGNSKKARAHKNLKNFVEKFFLEIDKEEL